MRVMEYAFIIEPLLRTLRFSPRLLFKSIASPSSPLLTPETLVQSLVFLDTVMQMHL